MINNTFVTRMQDEHKELSTKIDKLEAFIYKEGSPFKDITKNNQVEVCKQLAHMKAYQGILGARIWTATGDQNG